MQVNKPAAQKTAHRAVLTAALITATLLSNPGCTQPASRPANARATVLAAPPPRLSAAATLAALQHPTTAPTTMATTMAVATATTLPTAPIPTTILATRPTTGPASMPTTQAIAAPVASMAPYHPAPLPTDPAEQQADAALAERIGAIAQSALPTKVPSNDLWNPIVTSIGAMLSAGVKLDPSNARLARLAVDAALRTGDQTTLLSDLYAAHAAGPNDQLTTARIIDWYLARMQTSSEKLAYLKDALGKAVLPAPVRAHAGAMAAKLLLERDQPDAASKVLAEALRLNPASIEGLRLRYAMLPADALPFERATVLLQLLRANPMQATYTTQLADLLASAGLSHEAIPWYQMTITLTASAGRADLRAAQDCSAELLLADQEPDAASLAQQLVTADPSNTTNWFLKLAVIHGNTSNDDYQKTLQQARNVAGNALVVAAAGPTPAAGTPGPTTRPLSTTGAYPLPDLSAAVSQVQSMQDPAKAQASARLVAAAADLATLELLYAHDAGAAAAPIAALAKLLPADHPTLQRLQGWAAMLNGDRATALQQLSAAAETDPLAALGLIKLQSSPAPATSPSADAAATTQMVGQLATTQASASQPSAQDSRAAAVRLLSAHPGELMGAVLFDQLRDTGARPVLSTQASSLQGAVDAFPMGWLNVLSQPQSFYNIQVEPIDVARTYGQPLLATLTIQNIGDLDLTLGEGGLLQRGIVFGAEIHGITDKHFASVAYDELAGPLVLPARQSMSQVIRLDQGALEQYLDDDPSVALQVYGSATSNPAQSPGGTLKPAAAGYTASFGKVFGRLAAPLGSDETAKALQQLVDGTSRQKLESLQLLGRIVQRSEADTGGGDTSRLAFQLEAIRKAEADRSPAVSAWAGYLGLLLFPVDQRAAVLDNMVHSTNWRARELVLVVLPAFPLPAQATLAGQLRDDPEPCVRALALARLAVVQVASTLPATMPSK